MEAADLFFVAAIRDQRIHLIGAVRRSDLVRIPQGRNIVVIKSQRRHQTKIVEILLVQIRLACFEHRFFADHKPREETHAQRHDRQYRDKSAKARAYLTQRGFE